MRWQDKVEKKIDKFLDGSLLEKAMASYAIVSAYNRWGGIDSEDDAYVIRHFTSVKKKEASISKIAEFIVAYCLGMGEYQTETLKLYTKHIEKFNKLQKKHRGA